MSTNIPEQLDFSIRRKRILEPSSFVRPHTLEDPQEIEKFQQRLLDSTYQAYQRASDKANIIMKYAARVARKYKIPLREESAEIRQAVLRQDPDSKGSYISFDLFLRMTDIVEGMASRVTYDIIDNRVIADPNANERIIRKQLDSRFDDDEDGMLALLLVGGQLLTLYLIHVVTGMWRSAEKPQAAVKTAGPLPCENASPFVEAIKEAAIGMATSAVILGVNQALAFLFMGSEGTTDYDPSEIRDGAIGKAKQTTLPPILGRIKKIMGLDDHKIILDHSIKYIAETDERGYEFWWAYFVSRRTRYTSNRALNSAPMFSKKHHAKQNYSVDTAIVDPNSVQEIERPEFVGASGPQGFLENLAAGLQDSLNASIVRPTDEFLCANDYEAVGFEKGLNALAQIIDSKLARDVLCCLIRFLGNIDVEILKKIRAVIGIFLNAQIIHLAGTLGNFIAYLLSWVRDTVIRLIMELVQAILDKIYDLLAKFLVDISADLGILEVCPLILQLIQAVLDALDLIFRDIEEVIKNYVTALQLNLFVQFGLADLQGEYGGHGGLIKIHKKRSLRRLLVIIDGIIEVLESVSILCDVEERDNLEKQGLHTVTFDEILDSPEITDVEEYLDIPQEIKETYFADAYEIRLGDGDVLPDYQIGEVRLEAFGDSSGTLECKRDLSDDVIRQAVQKYKDRV
jgi:hypothetical protein